MATGDSMLCEQGGKVILSSGLELNMSREEYMYMRFLQEQVMKVLLVVDQFCRDNDLTYYLGEGTLLGAVRHGGFIPWDDDADILMPRADYDRFLQLAKNGLPDGYVLDCMDTNPKFWTISAKVEMTRKALYSKKNLEGIALCNGPCLDIFPLDFVPSDRLEDIKKRGDKVRILRRVMWIKSGAQKHKSKNYYLLKLYGAFRSSLHAIYDQIHRIMTATDDSALGYLCVFGSLYSVQRETFKKEYFAEPAYIEFEGHKLPVPSEPDRILKRIYGDYMQYPPVKQRKSKHSFAIDKDTLEDFEGDEALLRITEGCNDEPGQVPREVGRESPAVEEDTPESPETGLTGVTGKAQCAEENSGFKVIKKPIRSVVRKLRRIAKKPFRFIKKRCKAVKKLIRSVIRKLRRIAKNPLRFIKKRCKAIKKFILSVVRKQRRIAKKTFSLYKKRCKKIWDSTKRLHGTMRRRWIAQYYKLPVLEKTVLYDAFAGLGILDSPRTLFKRLLEREEFSGFTHVWTVNDTKMSKFNIEEFSDLSNVIFVKRNSRKYLRYLTTSKYLISNSSLPEYFARRPEQVYLSTWNKIPEKLMGYERVGHRVSSTRKVIHNLLNATHLLSVNHFTYERIYKQAYLLDGIYEGRILDEPLPKTDTICGTDRGYVLERLKSAGIVTGKKMIVYAPKLKVKRNGALKYDFSELKDAVRTLRENIDTSEYDVFLRVNHELYHAISMDGEIKKICIPFTIDTNELLSVTEILISDYSSIFFDFLSTKRPILFYIPDTGDDSENRGLYIPMEEMPGPVSTTLEEVADKINHIEKVREDYSDKYNAIYEWWCTKEDGKVSDRIIDDVFLNKESRVTNCKNKRKKLLFMAEFSKSFVSQTDLTELFKQIDYSRYDVTLLTGDPKDKYRKQMLEEIDPHVRILINNKAINCRQGVKKSIYKALRKGRISLAEAVKKLECRHEWQRLVGDSVFDQLCVLQPTASLPNWLILSYIAPINDKVFIQSETAFRSAVLPTNMLSHFNTFYDELDFYCKTI